MTLEERLNQNPDEFVYIGSASAFVAIGTAADMLEEIDDASKAYYNRYNRVLNTNRKRLSYLSGTLIPRSNKIIGNLKHDLKDYEKKRKLYSDDYDSTRDMPETIERYTLRKELRSEINFTDKAIESIKERLEDAKQTLAGYEREVANLKLRIPELERYIAEWVDFSKREIVREYPHRMVEPIGTNIIIAGNENGDYWTYAETLDGKKYGDYKRMVR